MKQDCWFLGGPIYLGIYDVFAFLEIHVFYAVRKNLVKTDGKRLAGCVLGCFSSSYDTLGGPRSAPKLHKTCLEARPHPIFVASLLEAFAKVLFGRAGNKIH